MTTFDDIYNNALEHKVLAKKLIVLLENAISEKALFQEVVSWFRGKNRYLNKIITPTLEEIDKQTKALNIEHDLFLDIFNVKSDVLNLIADNRYEEAQKLIEAKVEETFNRKIKLTDYKNEMDSFLSSLEDEAVLELKDIEQTLEIYKQETKHILGLEDMLINLKSSKDIHFFTLYSSIENFNEAKKKLEIDLPDIPELPTDADETRVEELHSEIRNVISEIDSLYPMKLFSSQKRILRKIIHDVGNERGCKAFENRLNELITNTNFSINQFNSKYWQITGKRWERVSKNAHGYRTVKATHESIAKI